MQARKFTPAQQAEIDKRKAARDASRKAAMADMWASMNDNSPEPIYSEEEIAQRAIAHRAAINAANEAYAIANAPAIAEVARVVAMIDPTQTYCIRENGHGSDEMVVITSRGGKKVTIEIPMGRVSNYTQKGYEMSAETAIAVIEKNIKRKFIVS